MSVSKDSMENPTYDEVCTGETGHIEVLSLLYNEQNCKFEDLVKFFYTFHDPTTVKRQGNDEGEQYSSAIFCTTPDQLSTAQDVTQKLQQILTPTPKPSPQTTKCPKSSLNIQKLKL